MFFDNLVEETSEPNQSYTALGKIFLNLPQTWEINAFFR